MQEIIIDELKGTGKKFERIVINRKLADGGQGEIYLTGSGKHVVKIFKEPIIYETTAEIIESFNQTFLRMSDFENHPSLQARPLFCFAGRMGGQRVYGSVSVYLRPGQFVEIDQIVPVLKAGDRIKMCRQIAEVFEIFSVASYVYVDLSDDNLFVNRLTKDIVFIDFESGGIIRSSFARTNTIGKASGYEPPELILKSFADKFKFWVYLDWWSMAVLMFQILTGFHPFIMFGAITEKTAEVLSRFQWPGVPVEEWRDGVSGYYNDFKAAISKIPPGMLELFKKTFNDGFFDPTRRVSPNQWLQAIIGNAGGYVPVLKNYRFLIGKNCKILELECENTKLVLISVKGWVRTFPAFSRVRVQLPWNLNANEVVVELFSNDGVRKKQSITLI